jgi:hypothetical protein
LSLVWFGIGAGEQKKWENFSDLEFREFGTAESGISYNFLFLYLWPSLTSTPTPIPRRILVMEGLKGEAAYRLNFYLTQSFFKIGVGACPPIRGRQVGAPELFGKRLFLV